MLAWLSQHTLVRFLVVGVISTTFNYALYAALLWAGVPYGLAFVLGFLLGVAVGFLLNKHWTYSAHDVAGKGLFARYAGVYSLSLIGGGIALRVMVERFGIDPLYANFGTIFVTTGINYLGTRFLVFRP